MIELNVDQLNEAELGIALDQAALSGLDVRAGDTLLVTGGPREFTMRLASPATLEALPSIKSTISRFSNVLSDMKD